MVLGGVEKERTEDSFLKNYICQNSLLQAMEIDSDFKLSLNSS